MTFCRSFVFLTPLACLLAQTPPSLSQPKPAVKAATAQPAASAAPATPAAEVPPDRVILTVGEEKLTAGELSAIIGTLPEQHRATAAGPGRKDFIESLIRLKLLAQEGRRRKLDQDPAYQAQAALQKDNLLAGHVFNAVTKGAPIADADIQQYYDQHKKEYESAKASHILIRYKGSPVPLKQGQSDLTEAQSLAKAQGLLKEIQAGGDFAAIAKRESDDGGSGMQGGSLGTVARGQMIGEFDAAVFTQPVGVIGEPVKTVYGYHLVRVDERKTKSVADTRGEIEAKLRSQAAAKLIDSLRQGTNIIIDPDYVGTAKPAQAPAGAAVSAPGQAAAPAQTAAPAQAKPAASPAGTRK